MQKEFTQQSSKTPDKPVEEKLEFLKRAEVRTMAKDIARLRKAEAKEEREHIAKLQKPQKPKEKPQVVLLQELKEKSQEQPLAPKKHIQIPRRPLKQSEKLFIRLFIGAIFVFLIFNLVALGFWYFFKRNVAPQPAQQANTQQEIKAPVPSPITPVTPEPQSKVDLSQPQPIALIFFFEAKRQEILLGNTKELLQELEAVLATPPALGFLNIVVKTQTDILSTQQFLAKSKIAMPQELKEKLGENVMIFAYTTEQRKRLGFIIDLKETKDVSALLRSWELNMEQNVASFFSIIGKRGSAYTPFFRSATHNTIPVRFKTFSVLDFGIVYGIVDNKLLFTSSFESFQRAADLL